AHREAAADTFGDSHNVRRDARPLVRPHLAGAAGARLHFVEDDEEAVVVGELAQAAEIFVRRSAHAAFALYRLEDDRRGCRADEFLQRIQVAPRRLNVAGQTRAEAIDVVGVAAGVDGGVRAAVERALE